MKKPSAFLSALILCGLVWISPASSYASEIKLPVPEIETLANGMQLVWFVNDKLPVVDMAVMMKSGYRDDPVGKSGTVELLASALERGAGGLTAQQIAHSVEELGASRYAAADEDTFSMGMHGLAPDAPALLDLLSKMVLHPDFPEAEVVREHARILDRWNHLGDYGDTLAGLAYHRLITAGTPYGRGSFSSAHEFKNVTRDDVTGFYKKHFTPKNAIFMVVGQVNKVEFKKKIEMEFGGWQGEAPAHESRKFSDSRLSFKKGEIVLVDRPGLTQAQVRIGFRSPLIKVPEHYALVVANAMLGEYFNSRLNSIIRDKLALTYGINSAFSYSKDAAEFTIASATRNDASGQLIRKTMEVVEGLKQGPIPAEEVTQAKEYLIGGFPLHTSTLGAVAARWLAGYIFDLGPTYLNDFVPKAQAVVTGDVLKAVQQDFDTDHWVIVVAGDASKVQKNLEGSKFKVRKISARDLM